MMYSTLRGYLHNTNMKTFSLKILGSSDDERFFTLKECMYQIPLNNNFSQPCVFQLLINQYYSITI